MSGETGREKEEEEEENISDVMHYCTGVGIEIQKFPSRSSGLLIVGGLGRTWINQLLYCTIDQRNALRRKLLGYLPPYPTSLLTSPCRLPIPYMRPTDRK